MSQGVFLNNLVKPKISFAVLIRVGRVQKLRKILILTFFSHILQERIVGLMVAGWQGGKQ